MSQADREKIVEQMKADAAQRQEQLVNLVRKTLSAQASAFGTATGDNFWKMLSGGNFTVDAANQLFEDYYKSKEKEDVPETDPVLS